MQISPKYPITAYAKAGVRTIPTKQHRRLHAKLIARLVEERKKAGIGQVGLAKRLKRSQTWVARTENGKRRLGVIDLITLAKVIGFDAGKLINEIQT